MHMATKPKPTADKQLRTVSQNLQAAGKRFKDADTVTVGEVGLTQKTKLPKTALDAVIQATALAAEGKHARVIVVEDEISTSEAADVLGISRPHLIGLLDAGRMPYRKSSDRPNAHRYVKTDDVLDYRRRRATARKMMDEYGAISEKLGV
jgi:excisionase family DNA binding protein